MTITNENEQIHYVLLTKFWNEADRLESLVDVIAAQTHHPVAWLLIDDGSTDNSGDLFHKSALAHEIPAMLYSMPKKIQGNLDTIGKAYTAALNHYRTHLDNLSPRYLMMVDVDTRLPPNYAKQMCEIMERNPDVGCMSGQIRGDKKRTKRPMGSGIIIRWPIVQSIDKFWDVDADSFFSIRALNMGYRLMIRNDVLVEAEPSHLWSHKGRFRYGRLMYYVGKGLPMIIYEALRFLIAGDYATAFLRGYWQEWSRGSWRCDIEEVREYNSTKKILMDMIHRKKSTCVVQG